MEKAAFGETIAKPRDEVFRQRLLGAADGAGIPLRRVEVIDRDEGRLAAHGEAHVVGHEVPVDRLAERVEVLPRLVGERQGDARRFAQPRHRHVEGKVDARGLDEAGDRGGGTVMRRRAQRQVALAAEQAGGRVHADPAGAGDINLGPGVKVGKILVGPLRPFERLDVGAQLDEIAGDEARGEARAGAGFAPGATRESRHEPERSASVSSGSCTPGSMRITYLIARCSSRLRLTRNGIVLSRRPETSRKYWSSRGPRGSGSR